MQRSMKANADSVTQMNRGQPMTEAAGKTERRYRTVRTERVEVASMRVQVVEQQPDTVPETEKARIENVLFRIFQKYSV